MSEITRRGEEWITPKSADILYHIGETDNSVVRVALLINKKRAPDIVIRITKLSERMAYVILLLSSKLKFKFIQTYAPKSTAEEGIEKIYEDFNSALTLRVFQIEDFNAKV